MKVPVLQDVRRVTAGIVQSVFTLDFI